MRNKDLHEALVAFPLAQTGGELSFLDRLCRENQWTAGFGLRAIGEYKRFIYLAVVSPTPVTPSDEVDQVWHLHLVYTRSYWEDLQAILGRPLHHGPTAGGRDEDDKFAGWYERTKLLYESEFGEKPPVELWPPSEIRFHPGQRFRRLDAGAHWIIAKPTRQWWQQAAGWAPLPLSLPLLAASGGLTLFLFAILFIAVVLIAIDASGKPRRSSSSGGGCSSFIGCGSSSGDCGDSGDCGGSGCGSGGCGGGGCGGGGCGS